MPETILVVDDEESVRKTFCEWLAAADLGCCVLEAADAQQALTLANQHLIDLAILDWNLGAGNDGLHLLEDLYLFNPDVVAILITGYAHQATPLDAMRMGVRDYLDKNQHLNRKSFLEAVRKQLEQLKPPKRQRELHRTLVAFRDAVEKVLPLVDTTAALTDPVPFTDSVRHLVQFLARSTQAQDGVLLVHSYEAGRTPAEVCQAYDAQGAPLTAPLLPFAQSLASAVVSMGNAHVLPNLPEQSLAMGVQLQAFEKPHQHLLACPLTISPNLTMVLELFDKQPTAGKIAPQPFTEQDRELVAAAAPLGTDLIRQAVAERQTRAMLMDAVGAALTASQQMTDALQNGAPAEQPLPSPDVLAQLRTSLERAESGGADPEQTLRLAELLRTISTRHGPDAVKYCIEVLEGVDRLLQATLGVPR